MAEKLVLGLFGVSFKNSIFLLESSSWLRIGTLLLCIVFQRKQTLCKRLDDFHGVRCRFAMLPSALGLAVQYITSSFAKAKAESIVICSLKQDPQFQSAWVKLHLSNRIWPAKS